MPVYGAIGQQVRTGEWSMPKSVGGAGPASVFLDIGHGLGTCAGGVVATLSRVVVSSVGFAHMQP